MARYQVILAYDGTEFHGFQRQGASRTVQGAVEEALRCIGWEGKSITAAGRTDAGVHASGQVIAFDLVWNHTVDALHRALNANLPIDISARQVARSDDGFHPRFDALWRVYHYHVFVDPVRDPFRERFGWRLERDVDVELLHKAAALICGRHDFAGLGSPMKPGGTTVREVHEAYWQVEDTGYRFVIKANAFLYHMVRRLVQVQVRAGQGMMDLDVILKGIQEQVAPPGGIAPACGLVLAEVHYQGKEEKQ